MIVFAHAAPAPRPSRPAGGWQTKIRSRLGVALKPLGLNGPRTWNELTRYNRSWPPPFANICSWSSDSAKVRRLNATPILCGPAVACEADVLQARVDAVERAVLHLVVQLHVLFAADHRLVDDLVVHGHDQRVLELHAVAPDVGDHVGDVDDVFAVRREIDVGEDAAARAERQPGHVRELRAGAGAEGPSAGPRVGTAHRLHGHGARGDDVLLDEGRRHLQRRRDVVEALGDVVGRQHLGGVEVHRQQIAHGVARIPCD